MSNSDQRVGARLLPFGLSPLFPYGPIRPNTNSRNSPVLRKIPESLGTFPMSEYSLPIYLDIGMVPGEIGHIPEHREVTGTPREVYGPYCSIVGERRREQRRGRPPSPIRIGRGAGPPFLVQFGPDKGEGCGHP